MSEFRDELGRFLPANQFSKMPEDELERLIGEYCEHRAAGKDKESFVPCDYRTLEKNASDLQAEKIEEANRKGWSVWENILRLVTLGQNVILPDNTTIIAADCNPTLLIFSVKAKMRAVYGEKLAADVKAEVQTTERIDYSKLSNAALSEIAALRSVGGTGGAK